MSDDVRVLPGVPGARRSPGWARRDPIDELAADWDESVAAAVHPDEIAALLESDGLSDDQIRERYGVENSFALAEELYARTPRRHPEPDGEPPDPWRTGLLGCLLRGLVFALPGFAYVLGDPLLAGPHEALGLPAGTRTLLAGALCGWAWNQGLAHRAYAWLGLGDRPAARRCLLVGAPVGMLLGTLVALAVAGPGRPAAVAFAAGQSCYFGASGVLLVMGREQTLLAALLPMTAGGLLTLAHPLPAPVRLVLLLGSLAAVAVLGLLEAAPVLTAPRRWRAALPRLAAHAKSLPPARWWPSGRAGRTAAPPVTGPRPLASLPYAVFGLASGVLVVDAALGDVLAGAGHGALAAPAAVALTLSMGPAEWLLYRFRGGSLAALRTSGTPGQFRRTTARVLARCLTAYLAALLTLTLAVTAPWPHAPAPAAARLTSLLALGVVLWTGLLLQSFGAVLGATAVCCAASVAQTLALLTHAGSPDTVALAVYASAAGAQVALVRVRLGRVTAHR
ncbi:hypothetical protein PV343_39800 [Streptomyces sp. WI03-4A]|uniref:hypothetical protein n=1 Tax=Streptomyces sp. WI03-4A TaxID=3028706 RepID=UPI0029A4015F|nr:hypothetical protein [Streptomyces sp. WI03-4A]MDX2598344.1 hypothetical protein [Streptomyces sp. WI03-4A]